MPLEHSTSKEAFTRNVKTLMGEVGQSPHVKSRAQALRIAYEIRRGRARGGAAATPRPLYRKPGHAGPITSAVPGRTDNHAMAVAPGAYVLPADHVSSLGEGNTGAGMSILQHMFGKEGPYGIGKSPSIRKGAGVPKPPKMQTRADGGEIAGVGAGDEPLEGAEGEPVEIMAAGGEFVIPPDIVAEIGGGDLDRGHQILDQWVVANRKKHVATLKKLPGPAKS